METLAYLHAAVAYEEPESIDPDVIEERLVLLQDINWQALSAQTTTSLLAIACSFSILGVAQNVLAAPPTTPAMAATPQRNLVLQRGNRGAAVADLQNRLRNSGYFDGPMTGFFGRLTESAVLEFQRAKGLVVDGKAGPQTLTALRQTPVQPLNPPLPQGGPASPVVGVLRRGDRGSDVAHLQNRLRNEGYFDGPMTGFFGRLTESAVTDFQRDQGLMVDGKAGPQTLTALLETPLQTSSTPLAVATVTTTPPATSPALSPTATAPADDTLLEKGDSGPAVAALQAALQQATYLNGPVTGFFGDLTEAAILQFQQDNGLTADGKVGPRTMAALSGPTTSPATTDNTPSTTDENDENRQSRPSSDSVNQAERPDPTLNRGDRGSAVAELQQQLRSAGYFDGPMTGFYGRITEAAVMEFQKDNGLAADGKAGPQTQTALSADMK